MKIPAKIDEVLNQIKEENKTETSVVTAATQEAGKEKATPVAEAGKETPQFNLDDLTDEQLNQLAEKRGFKVQKNEVEITAEEKQRQEQLEEVEKLQYAVATDQITPERYNELKTIIAEDGANLTKKEFKKLYKDEYKSAEELNDAYDDYYMVGKNIKVKEKTVVKDEDGYEKEEEVEVEKPKFDEKYVKWGQQRLERTTQRIKESAKKELDAIDAGFKNYKALDTKAKQYTGEVEKLVSSITSEKYPVAVKAGKEKVNLTIDLGAEAKEKIKNHLINDVMPIFLNGKLPEKEELSKIVDGYVKLNYEDAIQDKYYEYVEGIGIRKGMVGANAPLQKETFSTDKPDELAAAVNKAIPKELGGLITSIKK
jgi:hypothetical protein